MPASTSSDGYSGGTSEEITGQLLRKVFPRREDYVVATKVYFPTGSGPNDKGLSRKHIFDSIDAPLRRLGLDHVEDEVASLEEPYRAQNIVGHA